MTIRVVLIDDHEVVLDGLQAALALENDLAVIARATSLAEARSILARESIDVILVDIRLSDGSGLELLAEASPVNNDRAWIVLSSFETPQYLATALRLGAAGYLLKTAPIAEVIDAIRRVAAGGSAFTRQQLQIARESASLGLAPLERRILRGLVAGRSNDEIARDLGVARKTVEARLSRLYELYDVPSRTALALRAEREGWLDVP